jgi:Asp/Glu/hydantoin racemase
LVACYSVNPLLSSLAVSEAISEDIVGPLVTGIFEASILTAMSLVVPSSRGSRWGIVTTGSFWEQHLSDGVHTFLGHNPGSPSRDSKFAGVVSTGLNASDFHTVDQEDVRTKLKEATARLLHSGRVGCVVMGCAGMAGLEEIIRSVAVETYGPDQGSRIAIVDAVKAGVLQLEIMVKSRRLFQQ